MKCLACGKETEVSRSWILRTEDFEYFGSPGVPEQRIRPFCTDCKNSTDFRKIDKIAYDYWLSKEGKSMKCLACNKNEGVHSWWLDVGECPNLNLKERFNLQSCFCNLCYQDKPGFTLSQHLANYYLSNQPIDEIMQTKVHYYKWHPKAECIEISQEFCSNLGQALQYVWRSETLNPKAVTKGQSTDDIIKDLEKAQNFIGYEIERLKGKNTNA